MTLVVGITLLAILQASAGQVDPSTIESLVTKASRQGPLRVIVELRIDPPGPPSREAIAHAQDLVLQELAGSGHRVLRRFTSIPFLGLEVTPDALRRLGGSERVAGIREDMVLRPQGSPVSP